MIKVPRLRPDEEKDEIIVEGSHAIQHQLCHKLALQVGLEELKLDHFGI